MPLAGGESTPGEPCPLAICPAACRAVGPAVAATRADLEADLEVGN